MESSGVVAHLAPLRRYGRHLRDHALQLLLVPPLVVTVCMLAAALRPPVYESSTMLSLQPLPSAQGDAPVADPERDMETVARLMASPAVIESAARSLADEAEPDEEQARSLLRGIDVVTHPRTRLLELRYHSSDPQMVRRVPDVLADSYLDHSEQQYIRRLERESAAVFERLDALFGASPEELSTRTGRSGEGEGSPLPGSPDDEGLVAPPLFAPAAAGASGLAIPADSTDVRRIIERSVMESIITGFRGAIARPFSVRIAEQAGQPVNIRAGLDWVVILWLYALALLLTAGVVMLRQRLRNRIEFPDDAARLLKLPLLGSLPALDSLDLERALVRNDIPPDTDYAEAVRNLRTRLQLADDAEADDSSGSGLFPAQRPARTILVSSALGGEGKTSVAVPLALSLGQVERVLLINADLRGGGGSWCGLAEGAAGLSHLIAGAAQMRDCIHRLSGEGIDVMPAGVVPPNPQELLSSRRFGKIMQVLTRRYDCVIVDAPSLGGVSDSLLLLPHVSRLLFVARSGHSRAGRNRDVLENARRRTDLPETWLVLNDVDADRARRYGMVDDFGGVRDGHAYGYSKPGGRYLAGH